MKILSILQSNYIKSEATRQKAWFAACMPLLIVLAVAVAPVVLAQINLDIDAEFVNVISLSNYLD